jgi:hypothetical protein
MPEISDSFGIIEQLQRAWAKRKGILIDKRRCCVRELNDNLFQPLHPITRKELQSGAGGELKKSPQDYGKLFKLYSSAALGCNFFDHWRDTPDRVALCFDDLSNGSSIRFEKKLPIFSERTPAHVDLLLTTASSPRIALEFKFGEPYYRYSDHARPPFSERYFGRDAEALWDGLPKMRDLAEQCNHRHRIGRKGGLHGYTGLDVPQLIKMALGLRRRFGECGWKLGLIWYDVLDVRAGRPTHETECMRTEIATFSDTVASECRFFAITWREVFSLIQAQSHEGDREYLGYIGNRYFAS